MRMSPVMRGMTLALAGLLLVLPACQQAKPDYNRPLPPGQGALRLLRDPAQWPDLRTAYEARDRELEAALGRSIAWFDRPSTQGFFPPPQLDDITHQRAHVSAYAFRELLRQANSASAFERAIRDEFHCYTSVGYDDRGSVLYTGYFTPIFQGSRQRTERYRHPLYKRPDSLVTEPRTGRPLGRRTDDGEIVSWPPRAELERSDLLDGLELVYLPDKFDAYIIHINGSARIDLRNGETMYVGYAGKTDREYRGIGQALLDEGVFTPERLSLPAIRQYFTENPHLQDRYINRNESYVFFTEYDGGNWPSGSIGVKVATKRTLATDKSVFPRAGVVLVDTAIPTQGGGERRFTQFMLDQDTGGAIRAAGRADIYMGIGDNAETLAGRQFAEGRLYYFFLRPESVSAWRDRMEADGHADASSGTSFSALRK
ncbi:MAG: MltA domain-containing protein [Phycisphaeraceae bacterium]